jgi:hypothetical protein
MWDYFGGFVVFQEAFVPKIIVNGKSGKRDKAK